MKNAIEWFEIPALDLDRACTFYETVLRIAFKVETVNGRRMAVFARDQAGVGGALVLDSRMRPSLEGALVYLSAGEDLDAYVERIVAAGGQVVVPKTDIGDPGFIAIFQDTEGNRVALHTPRL
jgi:predicted enzyme related to lactoylglutathione lyase